MDYFDLSVTVYHFYMNTKQARIPVQREKYVKNRQYSSLDLAEMSAINACFESTKKLLW